MPEKTPSRWPEFACRKQFTSDSWQLKHITLHHPEHLQVAHQKDLTIRSVPQRIQPAQRCEFNATKDSLEYLDAFPHLEHVENIADLESQPPPPLPGKALCPGAGTVLIDYITERCKSNA
jgi:hypothetical protein